MQENREMLCKSLTPNFPGKQLVLIDKASPGT